MTYSVIMLAMCVFGCRYAFTYECKKKEEEIFVYFNFKLTQPQNELQT